MKAKIFARPCLLHTTLTLNTPFDLQIPLWSLQTHVPYNVAGEYISKTVAINSLTVHNSGMGCASSSTRGRAVFRVEEEQLCGRCKSNASKNRSSFPSCMICIHKNVLVSAWDNTAYSLSNRWGLFHASVTFQIGIETCDPMNEKKRSKRSCVWCWWSCRTLD